ncbi:MAG: GNAT family N-acetyltransferase [Caldilinea sp.]|uniref:GNAT family N-acetyltransferase n=1 Tax=Caldilinea sp. TaxID=2293560 RepID=UPI002BDCBE99|nr:GNAT family N-acetyltransferase [Caldilinea sp.]HRA66469.1 GNAT family N-acetyltransferase [Caldilinea sp.]
MMIARITPADFAEVARLLEAHNANPATQCLHSGEHAGEVEAVFQKQKLLRFVVARENGAIVGAMGCEVDEGRGYLQGPFVESGDFLSTADALWRELQSDLPTLERCDAFLNVKNERAAAFYLGMGFKRGQGAQVYVLPADALPALNGAPAARFTPDCADEVRALHQLAFPDSPHVIDAFMETTDDERCLFVCSDGARCLGYIAASINDSPREGYIDLLAVAATVRNQGYGQRLLLTAAHWLIVERGMPQVGLTVRDMRADARRLYQRSGFQLLYAGVGYSRDNGSGRRG